MPKAAKNVSAPPENAGELSFEEALHKLEAIVEAMESGDLPLESMLSRCEEGAKLSQICQAKRAEAELKIQQLETTASGEPALKPFALTEEDPEA